MLITEKQNYSIFCFFFLCRRRQSILWNLLGRRNHQRILNSLNSALLLFSFVLDLSIYLSDSIRNFQIGSSHIYSSTINFSDLNLSNQLLSDLLIYVPYKAKAPTRLAEWISNDLTLFNFAILLKMAPKTLVREIII